MRLPTQFLVCLLSVVYALAVCPLLRPLALYGLVACDRADEDPARRAQVVDWIVRHGEDRCLTGPIDGARPAYEVRLRAVLDSVGLETLAVVKDLEVVVCLDQRVGTQLTRWWSPEIAGVYYDTRDARVVSLWDDGAVPGTAWFFEQDAADRGPWLLGALANGFAAGAIPRGATIFGGWYTEHHSPESPGIPVFEWSSPSGFLGGAVARNTVLLDPPLVSTASVQLGQVDLNPRVSGGGDRVESPH